jgi:hypothetical protein
VHTSFPTVCVSYMSLYNKEHLMPWQDIVCTCIKTSYFDNNCSLRITFQAITPCKFNLVVTNQADLFAVVSMLCLVL